MTQKEDNGVRKNMLDAEECVSVCVGVVLMQVQEEEGGWCFLYRQRTVAGGMGNLRAQSHWKLEGQDEEERKAMEPKDSYKASCWAGPIEGGK